MGFLKFVREHLKFSLFLVLGAALNIYGIASDAYDAYQLGLPGWAWQIIGVLIIAGALFALAYRLKIDLQQAPIGTVPPTVARQPTAASKRNSTIILIDNTMQRLRAAMATTSNKARNAERVMPEISAALLTLHKDHGIPTPPPTAMPQLDMQTAYRFLEQVGPYLRRGHDEEAHKEAEKFIAKLG